MTGDTFDQFGRELRLGDHVYKAYLFGPNKATPLIGLHRITRVEGTKVYLDNSHNAVKYNERLVRVEQ